MKNLMIAALLLMGSSASATTMLCQTSAVVGMQIEITQDATADFVMMTLVEPSGQTQFYNYLEAGEAANQLSQGFFSVMAMTEQTAEQNGVIVNTGLLSLSKNDQGLFEGILLAKGNIYPMACQIQK